MKAKQLEWFFLFFFTKGGKPETHGDKMLYHLSHSAIFGLSKKKGKNRAHILFPENKALQFSRLVVWPTLCKE